MLLITNGKLIVNPAMHIEELDEVIAVIKENAKNDGIKKPVFKKLKEPFDCYENSSHIDFFKIKQYCPEYVDIQFKAIGKESVTLPSTKVKDIKHIYTTEELDHIAEEFAMMQKEKEDLEESKKQISKKYSDDISNHETQISDLAHKYRLRYEIQSKDCNVILNFKESLKYYVDPETEELLHTEKLTTEDQRSLFDLEGFTPENYQDENTGFEMNENDLNDAVEKHEADMKVVKDDESDDSKKESDKDDESSPI